MGKISGKELLKQLNAMPPYGSVDMSFPFDPKFEKFNFKEVHRELWKECQDNNDLRMEFFIRQLGIFLARYDEMDKRIEKTIKEYPNMKNSKTGHHVLCCWNDDRTFCNCGVSNGD